MSADDSVPARRDFLRKSLSLIPVVALAGSAAPSLALAAPTPVDKPGSSPRADHYQPVFFTAEEWAFVQAAVARLIPADELGPGALEAGASEFIDRQMQTAYARGGLWYMQGPFAADAAPEMGYQSRLVPQDLYRLGIAAVDRWTGQQHGKPFAELAPAQQDEALKALESGDAQLDGVPAKLFFAQLLQNTKEGFYCDPLHGGNKELVGWKLVNFPGARADFMDWVERDERYPLPPVSIRGERG
ncbi:gluconate 2-dehydrogenase subunit 3 family protein [Pseudomonas oryzihabitans]|uniref:gluconate 2-dehydrogenase subunit 3 family protein n=1 Tax=Pseudomonas oryzihabitans TaxID=47885 RepID=UPI00111C97F2|nr:gluconate 2-dehydrogenase subunit 3 family protein [Pseudomonas psychrotolerans]QDD90727.1 gluconate 2-dehydrogenase [Pseudomonas psychrotolerans]